MTGVLWVQMGGPVAPVGSPDQAQMLAAAQQGFMHPGYAMYGPGMMCMGPQVSMSAKAPQFTASPYQSTHLLVACMPHMT